MNNKVTSSSQGLDRYWAKLTNNISKEELQKEDWLNPEREDIFINPKEKHFLESEIPNLKERIKCLTWIGQLVQESGRFAQVDNQVICCSQVLTQMYLYKHGLKKTDFRILIIACLFLAAKITDKHVKLSNLLIMSFLVYQLKLNKPEKKINLQKDTKTYRELKSKILEAEMDVLQSMGFDMHFYIKTGHIYLLYLQKHLKTDKEVIIVAWKILNDIYTSFLVAVLPPHLLACIALAIAFKNSNGNILKKPWWEIFELTEIDLKEGISAVFGFFKLKEGNYNLSDFKIHYGVDFIEDFSRLAKSQKVVEEIKNKEDDEKKDKKDKKSKKDKKKKSKKIKKEKKEKKDKKKKSKSDKSMTLLKKRSKMS